MNYSAAHVIAHTDPFFCAIRHQHLESDPNDHMKRKISRTPRSIHSYQFVSTHFLMSFCPRQQKIRPIRWNRWILLRFSRCYETSCLGWKFDEFWSKRVLGPHGNLLRPGAVCTMKLAACRRIQKDEPTRWSNMLTYFEKEKRSLKQDIVCVCVSSYVFEWNCLIIFNQILVYPQCICKYIFDTTHV